MFINYAYDLYQHLVDNNLGWWFSKGYVEISAKAFENKMGLKSGVKNIYVMFIDCKNLETVRPD